MGLGSKHNLHPDFIRNPAPMLEARQGAAYTGENMTSPESPAILYEHADGRRAVVSANRVATFAIDNPDWHRAGPVEIVWVDDPIRWPKNAKEVREGASYESMNLAAMVLSDCGHSSNYQPLLERVAGRIDRHVERLLTVQQADRALRAQAAPVAQGDALTDTYVQQVPDKCDRIVWRGRYYHLPIDAAEHSYTEPSPMAKVAAALRQKAEQEDAAYQARRSDQGLMESEWGPMEDAPPHEDPPMHVAVVEGDDTVRTLQWNRDVAAFAYTAGTLLYAARSQAKKGGV